MGSTVPATSSQDPRNADEPMPAGAWVRLFLPQQPEIIGFTYLDRETGFSAKGGSAGYPQLAERPAITVRLPGFSWQPLAEEEIARLGLPVPPSWVEELVPSHLLQPSGAGDSSTPGCAAASIPRHLTTCKY